MSMKIKKGDTVKVIAGKDKDKTGKVVSVDVKNNRVVVEGVNMITKHEKPSMSNQQGGIVNKEAPIDASNVMLVVKGVPTRVGIKVEMVEKNGKSPGTPTTVQFGGTSSSTTLPAPIFEFSPIVKEPITFAPALTITLSLNVG